MRSRSILVPALLAALPACAPAISADATRTLRAEISPAALGETRIENLAGAMRVVPGSGGAIVVVATVHAESDELAEAVSLEKARGLMGEPTLRVVYPLDRHSTVRYPPPGGSRGGSPSGGESGTTTKYGGRKATVSPTSGVVLYADVEVQLPARPVNARFRNVAGPLHGERVAGDLSFDTDSGGVTLSRLRGEIVADTGSGDVVASDIEGSFTCDTGSGACEASGVRGERVTCDTGSGDVTLRSIRVSGEVRADTGSGNVVAREIEGSLVCDTGSSDCDLEGVRGASVRCDTGSGGVRLRSIVAERVSADTGSGDVTAEGIEAEEFAADTGSGEVRLEASGSRLARVTADTGSGGVILRLGPDASFHALVEQGSGELVNRYADAQPIIEDRQVVGYQRGDGRTRIVVDTGSGSLTLEPGSPPVSKAGGRKTRPR